MLGLALAALLPLAPPARAMERRMKAAPPIRWTAPKGWKESEYANGADAVVAYESGPDRIEIKVFGAPKSFYRTREAFLAGPGATSMGRAPEREGSARVAGSDVGLYRREYPLPDGDPRAYSPDAPKAREVFCVLPPSKDGRFVVLAYSRAGPAPGPSGDAGKAWRAFLAGVSRARE